jgi:predicted DNA-binding transcriptional regulator AlpA
MKINIDNLFYVLIILAVVATTINVFSKDTFDQGEMISSLVVWVIAEIRAFIAERKN